MASEFRFVPTCHLLCMPLYGNDGISLSLPSYITNIPDPGAIKLYPLAMLVT